MRYYERNVLSSPQTVATHHTWLPRNAMITKNEIKEIRALQNPRQRKATGLFVAEGPKVVGELFEQLACRQIAATEECLPLLSAAMQSKTTTVSAKDMERLAAQKTPQGCVGVFEMPAYEPPTERQLLTDLTLALDGVQDPGNLGSIIRTAVWYGISHIVCSADTVDAFSPKVVQSTMGALGRIQITRCNLVEFLNNLPDGVPVYGTLLDGHNINDAALTPNGIIVMGNEGAGLSDDVRSLVSHRLLIPPYPANQPPQIESLNVALATAIVVDHFRRPRS